MCSPDPYSLQLFDERGRELLGRWLDGSGQALRVHNGNWGEYMKNNTLLPPQLQIRIGSDAVTRTSSGSINIVFSAEIENGYFTGYQMLHGTNPRVGNFEIKGNATVYNVGPGQDIEYKLTYTWNDIIDPNANYPKDTAFAGVLDLFYDPSDYDAVTSQN